MSFCNDCFKGVRHEGTPTGRFITLGGVRTYVAEPETDHQKDKAVLFLSDALGVDFLNNQLLVDGFAENGFKTVMLDLFDGDPAPSDALERQPPWDWRPWAALHQPEVARPFVDRVVAALKEEGVTTFGATGYCYGGKMAVLLAQENITKAIAISHPSFVAVPQDLEKLKMSSTCALLINSCEWDEQLSQEHQKIADSILGGGSYVPGYERTYWPGCTHGFAVAGDMSNPLIKAGKEGAFKATVDFLKKHT